MSTVATDHADWLRALKLKDSTMKDLTVIAQLIRVELTNSDSNGPNCRLELILIIFLLLAIYDMGTNLEFNCQYRLQGLEHTVLCLDYWLVIIGCILLL